MSGKLLYYTKRIWNSTFGTRNFNSSQPLPNPFPKSISSGAEDSIIMTKPYEIGPLWVLASACRSSCHRTSISATYPGRHKILEAEVSMFLTRQGFYQDPDMFPSFLHHLRSIVPRIKVDSSWFKIFGRGVFFSRFDPCCRLESYRYFAKFACVFTSILYAAVRHCAPLSRYIGSSESE